MSTVTEVARGKNGIMFPALVWEREHVFDSDILHMLAYRAEGLRFNFRIFRWVYTDPMLADLTEDRWTVVVHEKSGIFKGFCGRDWDQIEAAKIHAYDFDRWGN